MHFSDQKEGSMSESVAVFNAVNDEAFVKLIDSVFVVLLNPSQNEMLFATLEEVCSSAGISHSEGKQAANDMLTFIIDCLKKNLGDSHIEKQTATSELSESKVKLLMDCYSRNRVRLSARHLAQTAFNSLQDMEWKFGVTAASSELNTVGQTFLQLKMKIGDNTATETVHMELTLPQFYDFLHEMERAKANMELCT